MKSICVFCGSSIGSEPAFSRAARELGQAMAKQSISLVYGGGNIGLMGVIADEMLAMGSKVYGVIPDFLMARELGHPGVSEMHVVASMHERKIKLAELAEAFIVMPGGFGTLDELFEVLTWNQLGIIEKPVGILNVDGFYDPLIQMVDSMTDLRFVRKEHRNAMIVDSDPDRLIARLKEFDFPQVDGKWIEELKSSSKY